MLSQALLRLVFIEQANTSHLIGKPLASANVILLGPPSKRSKVKAPLFSCVDTRKFGGPNPGAVIYGRLATT